MQKELEFTVFRTERIVGGSNEYFVKYPDGFQTHIWSPSFGFFNDEKTELETAKKVARDLFSLDKHKRNVYYDPISGVFGNDSNKR